jgi:protein kinase C substrate 80K-H
MRITLLLALLAFAHCAEASALYGVKKSDRGRYSQSPFVCKDGQKLDLSRVNDNYCDCTDGSDEPGTSACANGRFWCTNRGSKGRELPSSRVNDGVCDCCDGSDEFAGKGCANTCAGESQNEKESTLAGAQRTEEGLKLRAAMVEHARSSLVEKESEKALLETEQEEAKLVLETARQVKEDEEAKEKAEQDRRVAERQANEPPAEPEKEVEEALAEEGGVQGEAEQGEAQEGQEEKKEEEEKFPYPDEYRYTEGEKEAAGEGGGEEEGEEFFPYPEEYRVKKEEDGEGHEEEEPSFEHELEEAEAGEEEEAQEVYKSPEADKARTEYDEADRVHRDLESRVTAMSKDIDANLGPDNVFFALMNKCFEVKHRQYTYEACLFGEAKQKEGSSGTSLGNFEKWSDDGSTMHFTGGQGCWQGPKRSVTVEMECGIQNQMLSVEEPSKCVYRMRMSTPAMCSPEELEGWMQRLATLQAEEEPEAAIPPPKLPRHTEL